MARRQYMGAHEVEIPIEEIMHECAAWSDEIVNAVADELLRETKKNARTQFDDETGYLRGHIKKKKSRFSKDDVIVIADAPHAHLIEFGHLMVKKDGTQASVNKYAETEGAMEHVPAFPFLGPAAETVRSKLRQIAASVGPFNVKVKR